jgi:outer membrane murein-binding lipoprotein Lpp
MSARSMSRLVLAALGVAVLLAGCAADPRVRVKQLEDEQRSLNMAVQAVDQSVQASSAYAAEIASPGQAGPTFSVYFTPAMLEQLSTQTLPYRVAAKEFHSKLDGEIIFERLSNFRFISRNRVQCQAFLRGVNVRYTGSVPSFAKGQVKDFQKAIAEGVMAELVVQLTLDGNVVRAKAEATSARLVSKRDGSAESTLRDEMNKRALRTPLNFDMTIAGSSAVPRRLMVTGNHVVVTYVQ